MSIDCLGFFLEFCDIMNKLRVYLSEISVCMAVVVMILSMQPWFVWGKSYMISIPLMLFLLLRFAISINGQYNFKKMPVITILLLVLWYLWYGLFKASYMDITEPFTVSFTKILPLFLIMIMGYFEKKKIVIYVTKLFAIILFVSIVAYCFYIIGFPLPYEIIEHPTNTVYNGFANFYFFIVESKFDVLEYLRFRSVFTEPGHVGMMCALYLYINEYDFKKWYNVIILLALVMSFSFAAYVLLLCGWMLYAKAVRLSFKPIILVLSLAILSAISLEICTLNKENKGVVSIYILERAKFDENKGLSGNNRNDEFFLNYYENFSEKIDYFVGVGRDEFRENFQGTPNSSYRNFIVQYGVIGLIIFIGIFFSILLYYPTRLGWGLFVLFLLSFIQRPYWIWEAQSYMFIAVIYVYYYESKFKMNDVRR